MAVVAVVIMVVVVVITIIVITVIVMTVVVMTSIVITSIVSVVVVAVAIILRAGLSGSLVPGIPITNLALAATATVRVAGSLVVVTALTPEIARMMAISIAPVGL